MKEKEWAQARLATIVKKYRVVAERTGTKIPYTTDAKGRFDNHTSIGGEWDSFDNISWWTNGFYPGILWQLNTIESNQRFIENAEKIEERLAYCLEQFIGIHHDVGFMFMPTSVYRYTLTHAEGALKRGLHAANLLAGRFNINGRFIRAWENDQVDDKTGWAIIDTMMNVDLLYWASAQTQDPRFAAIATAHANTTRKTFVRQDGSVRHIVTFDPETGDYLGSLAGQGYAHGSAWTRGQAWALYGFTRCYERTGDPAFLETAKQVAKYCLAHVDESQALPIDFDQPRTELLIDNSATVIYASGLLSLARTLEVTEPSFASKLNAQALVLLHLIDDQYADYTTQRDNLVSGASSRYYEKQHAYPIIYADFYYIEALMKICECELSRAVWA